MKLNNSLKENINNLVNEYQNKNTEISIQNNNNNNYNITFKNNPLNNKNNIINNKINNESTNDNQSENNMSENNNKYDIIPYEEYLKKKSSNEIKEINYNNIENNKIYPSNEIDSNLNILPINNNSNKLNIQSNIQINSSNNKINTDDVYNILNNNNAINNKISNLDNLKVDKIEGLDNIYKKQKDATNRQKKFLNNLKSTTNNINNNNNNNFKNKYQLKTVDNFLNEDKTKLFNKLPFDNDNFYGENFSYNKEKNSFNSFKNNQNMNFFSSENAKKINFNTSEQFNTKNKFIKEKDNKNKLYPQNDFITVLEARENNFFKKNE